MLLSSSYFCLFIYLYISLSSICASIKYFSCEQTIGEFYSYSLFGFPGLTLTPIPESPETDSLLNHKERKVPEQENTMWLESETSSQLDDRMPSKTRKDSLTPPQTPSACAVNVHVVQATFFSKDAPMTSQQRRAHLCKLSLFALCGFVFVAGIILWILSPTFT